MVARAGSSVSVACGAARVEASRTFAAGDVVLVDCGAGSVTVNGAAALADVTLGSDFFSLAPGTRTLAFSGCSSHTVAWHERWV